MNLKISFLLSFLILFLMTMNVKSQVVINGTENAPQYAVLKISTASAGDAGSTKNGGFRLPQMTDSEIATLKNMWNSDNLSAQGLTVFNTTYNLRYTWDGSSWIKY